MLGFFLVFGIWFAVGVLMGGCLVLDEIDDFRLKRKMSKEEYKKYKEYEASANNTYGDLF
ncbi:MAG: hypothetical protein HYV47_02405 [Candidatus Nealsonbacteria bacterium]|nr:hypothetical protein [Candidatus Nealsonbacteria bacterium]